MVVWKNKTRRRRLKSTYSDHYSVVSLTLKRLSAKKNQKDPLAEKVFLKKKETKGGHRLI